MPGGEDQHFRDHITDVRNEATGTSAAFDRADIREHWVDVSRSFVRVAVEVVEPTDPSTELALA